MCPSKKNASEERASKFKTKNRIYARRCRAKKTHERLKAEMARMAKDLHSVPTTKIDIVEYNIQLLDEMDSEDKIIDEDEMRAWMAMC